jgi:hypothetical protein
MNILAVIISTVIYFVLGALWYSTILFGNKFMDYLGKTADELEAKPTDFIGAAIAAIATNLVLALILDLIGTFDVLLGVLVALLAWGGFSATAGLYNVIFEGKKFGLYLIDTGYHLVGLIIAGVILGLWQ